MSLRKKLLLSVVLVASGIAAALTVAPRLPRWLDVGRPWQRVDLVLTLAGDEERRPFVSAAMVRTGLADQVAVVMTAPDVDVLEQVHDAKHVMITRIYKARGVPSERIVVFPGATTSTVDELEQLATYLRQHPQTEAGVVTSAYHTRRTAWTIRRMLPDLVDRIRVFSAPNPGTLNTRWWRTPEGLQTVTSEYAKLLVYMVRYAPRRALAVVVCLLLGVFTLWHFHRRTARDATAV